MLESYKPRWNESKEEKLGRYKRIQQEIQDFQEVVDQGQIDSLSPEAKKRLTYHITQGNIVPDTNPNIRARIGQGMMDIVRGTRQFLPEGYGGLSEQDQQYINKIDKKYASDVSQQDFDWSRLGGQAAMTAPLMLIPPLRAKAGQSLWKTVLKSAGLGGLAGASLYESDKEGKTDWLDKGINTAISTVAGGVLGAVGQKAIEGLGYLPALLQESFVRMGVGIPKQQDIIAQLAKAFREEGLDLSKLGDDVVQDLAKKASDQMKTTGSLDATALARDARARAFGYEGDAAPTKGQITRDPEIYTREVEVSKIANIGDELLTRFGKQRIKSRELLNAFQNKIFKGSANLTPYEAGNVIHKGVKQKAEVLQMGVRNAYDKIEGGAKLSYQSLNERTATVLDEFENIIPQGIKNKIKSFMPDEKGKVKKVFNFKEYEKLDKLINKTTNWADAAQASGASELKMALLNVLDDTADVAVGDNKILYQTAKKLARERFEAIGSPNKITAQFLRGTDPEKIVKKIWTSASIDDVAKLMKFVGKDSIEAKNIRAAVLNDIVEQVAPIAQEGKYVAGAFQRLIRKLPKEKLEIIFGKNKVAGDLIKPNMEVTSNLLNDFAKVLDDLHIAPPEANINYSNTASTLINDVGMIFNSLVGRVAPLSSAILKRLPKTTDPKTAKNILTSDIGLMGSQPKFPPLLSVPSSLSGVSAQTATGLAPTIGLLGANPELQREVGSLYKRSK